MKKIAMVSLGCDKNRTDSERILYLLGKGGYELTNDFTDAETIIVNTCAFIASAREEAIDTILEMAEYKKNKCKNLIVCGCLPQKYSDQLKELSEVDAFLGTKNYDDICRTLEEIEQTNQQIIKVEDRDFLDNANRIITTPNHYAYLKIADGCDNFCTFCTIPSIRGKYVSRTVSGLIDEANSLKDLGVKELILVAQDVTRFGMDRGQSELLELLRRLCELNITIRLMYCYPELVTEELITFISENENMAKYIDIPMQHADNKILKLMNRKSTYEGLCSLMESIDKAASKIHVRSTFMVGFPSENEDDFKVLCDFVKKYNLSNVGIFAYSKEENTPAAKLKNQISKPIKLKRVNELGKIVLQNCRERNKKFIGETIKVIYEDIDYERNMFKGRPEFSAPEIDSFVYFTADFVDVGNSYNIKITNYDEFDLIGEKI